MRELFQDAILPLFVIVAFVFGVTLLAFDGPPGPARASSADQPGASASAQAAHLPPSPVLSPDGLEARRPMRETANEVLARAMRTFDAPKSGATQEHTAAPDPARAAPGPEKTEETSTAMSAIAAAIRATREARTEADLIHAENALREARRRMQAGCAATGGPLCKSAEEMQRLGF
jgi:hypothetical protein